MGERAAVDGGIGVVEDGRPVPLVERALDQLPLGGGELGLGRDELGLFVDLTEEGIAVRRERAHQRVEPLGGEALDD